MQRPQQLKLKPQQLELKSMMESALLVSGYAPQAQTKLSLNAALSTERS